MAGAFATEVPATLFHHFQHVAVADVGTGELNAHFPERHFQRHIRHQGADCTFYRTDLQAVLDHHIQQLVAIINTAAGIDHHQAIGVAVQGNADICVIGAHSQRQRVRRSRTKAGIDVETVRLIADRNDFGPQLMEHMRSNMIGRTMGAIDHDGQPAQV